MGIGDLVRSADWCGDGQGGDFKKVVGEQIGTIVEIDQHPDYPIQYSVLWSDSKITMGDVEDLELLSESR